MTRSAWWGVGVGAALLVGGLVSGFWPLTGVGALIALVCAVVVVLTQVLRGRGEEDSGGNRR